MTHPDHDPHRGDGPSLQKGGGTGGVPQDGYGNPLPQGSGPYPAYGGPPSGNPGWDTPGSGNTPYGTPGPPPVGYPPVGYPSGPPAAPARNGLGIAALVLGIIAIPAGLFAAFVGIIVGVVAIILGAVALGRVRRRIATNKGMAIAGIVCGLIGAIVGTIFTVIAVRVASDCLDELGPGATQSELQVCATDKLGG